MSKSILDRLAGAPISWGVCEVPGWGLELPVDRVLSEMTSLGLCATELGPDGYLPEDPAELRRVVAAHDMQMIGGFVPLVIHDPSQESATIEAATKSASLMAAAGATFFVSAAITSWDWQPRVGVDADGWRFAAEMLSRIDDIAADHGMVQAFHPHLGTIVQTKTEIQRVMESTEVSFTLDTGHLLIGGYDPLAFVHDHFDRIIHVHLKDVDMSTARRVLSGELTLMGGVQAGMYSILGSGDAGIDKTLAALEERDYDGWYVIEQDVAITDGLPADGAGPIAGVAASADHLRGAIRRAYSQSAEK